jgi:hypothetical protein|nr:MAG TPA: hypothetical protein [Caudoviricetes sp.]
MNHDHIFEGAPETRRGLETRQNAIIALQWLIEEQEAIGGEMMMLSKIRALIEIIEESLQRDKEQAV